MLFYLIIGINYSYFLVNCTLECYKGSYFFHLIVFGLNATLPAIKPQCLLSFSLHLLNLLWPIFLFLPLLNYFILVISRSQNRIHFVIQAKCTFLKIGDFMGVLLWWRGLRIQHCHCYGIGLIPGPGASICHGTGQKKKMDKFSSLIVIDWTITFNGLNFFMLFL